MSTRQTEIPHRGYLEPGQETRIPLSNEALLLAASALEAADSLRSRAATIMERRSRAPRR